MSNIPSTFEFLSSFEQWERDCLRDPSNIDKSPKEVQNSEKWSVQSQLYAILMGYKGGEYGNLESLAKNGDTRKGILGYPKIVQGTAPTHLDLWQEQIFTPKPEDLTYLPEGSCLIKVNLRLRSPFFSRDDRPFYPTENVLKRQWAFHVPYLAAAGIKGLLTWAYRMTKQNENFDEIGQSLFGLANDANDSASQQGCLYTYPLFWQGNLGHEVINPQNRSTGAGTQPIKYEVVLPKATGDLYFVLAVPPMENDGKTFMQKHLPSFLQALNFLLQNGGLSAKKTAGWGDVSIEGVNMAVKGLASTAHTGQGSAFAAHDVDALWAKIEDEEGNLLPYIESKFGAKNIKPLLPDWSNKELKNKDAAYAKLQELHAERMQAKNTQDSTEAVEEVEEIDSPQWLFEEKKLKSLDAIKQEVLTLLQAEA